MSLKVFSVAELTSAIKAVLEPTFRGIAVRGEISNLRPNSSGHIYFSLKDAEAQLGAVLFRAQTAALSRPLKEGDQVVAKGELSLYAPHGKYQLIIRELQFLGVGELLLKLHQLKETLSQRGWFDPAHKKPLPRLPKRIGVVTSPTGAVIQDILHVLTRRFAGFQVVLNPVKVQGEGAAGEIALAIQEMNQFDLADVLIVGRGGGSIEDLWAFNEEIVAKAIFESRIPIISAVGHETDTTIADFVADVRAPTPSAAAEMAIAEKANLLKILDTASLQIRQFINQKILVRRQRLGAHLLNPVLSQSSSLLATPMMRLDDVRQQLETRTKTLLSETRLKLGASRQTLERYRPSRQSLDLKERLRIAAVRLAETIRSVLAQKSFSAPALLTRLDECIGQSISGKISLFTRLKENLDSLHPRNLLKKGFCLLFSEKEDSVILSARDLHSKQTFKAVLFDGKITATALQIEQTPDGPIL